jgi:glycogen phosphorylase
MAVARSLVQGADVWLNTPRRPLEASGTSGMKAAANGVLNMSTLDGWWDEAWQDNRDRPDPIGWAIGRGESYANEGFQDQVEVESLYSQLERDLVPTFYDRGIDGLPRRWIARMKSSISALCHHYNTHRMVREYTEQYYLPGIRGYEKLSQNNMAAARELAAWKLRLRSCWGQVRAEVLEDGLSRQMNVGSVALIRARAFLGSLTPDDVRVQLYVGRVDADGDLVDARAIPMEPAGKDADGWHIFEACAVQVDQSGLHGFTVRVVPYQPNLISPFLPGFIAWGMPDAKEIPFDQRPNRTDQTCRLI